MEIRRIGPERREDVRLPNEPFPLFGRMIPALKDGVWSYTVSRDGEPSEMCFPQEEYDYAAMAETCLFLGAYEEDRCVGLAILRRAMFRYMYLYDLKVCRAFRRGGTGQALIRACAREAKAAGYRGVYTVGQDNNLAACFFYLRCGFRIGGCDTEVYRGTKQEGKADILFYLDA